MTMLLEEILPSLAELPGLQARDTHCYKLLDAICREWMAASPLASADPGACVSLGDLGSLHFPFKQMGAVSSLDLFGLDELIIFAFYRANRGRYHKALDIGANIGLHSIMMERCGFEVAAYEPDPRHASWLRQNLDLNGCSKVQVIEEAVSDKPGELEFVRVLGNTTSSHLSGAKQNAYGELERFPVKVAAIADIMKGVDLIKMDAEGQERIILLGTSPEHWQSTDMMLEVGSPENAHAIFEHLPKLGLNAFAQKMGWRKVTHLGDMPTSYREGSLFLSTKEVMPWGES